MTQFTPPVVLDISSLPARARRSNYPEPFAAMMTGREKRVLGDPFGLQSFGVNHVTLQPGAMSALFHRHTVQDEWIMVLTGELVLVHDGGETVMKPGMCAGFPHQGTAHQLVNRSAAEASYLEIGDRQPGDGAEYPRDDLMAARNGSGWLFSHKDGRPYPRD